ncbi:hypothetical protein As57867_024207, partial [Aphanomyces stellatus]
LIVQALVIFVVLTTSNERADAVDLYSMDELLARADADNSKQALAWLFPSKAQRAVQTKLLETMFCRVFELPPLFSFPKYMLEIQETKVVELVELRVSNWIILVGYFLIFFTSTGELQTPDAPYRVLNDHSAVSRTQNTRVYIMIAWTGVLSVLLFVLLARLRSRLAHLVRTASSYVASHNQVSIDVEKHSATTADQIRQLRAISTTVSAAEPTKRRRFLNNLLLVRLFKSMCGKDEPTPNSLDARLPDSKVPGFSIERVEHLMQLYLILNALFCAILCTSVVPTVDSTTNGLLVGVCFALILFNMVVLAPPILSLFAVVRGVWKIDGHVLAKTLDHFVHVAKLKQELRSEVAAYLEESNGSLDGLFGDAANDGEFVDFHTCHVVLKQCGVTLTHHELNMLVYMTCKTSDGRVLLADFIKLCSMEFCPLEASTMSRQSGGPKENLRDGVEVYHSLQTPHMCEGALI